MRTLLAACALAIVASAAVLGARGQEQAQAGHEGQAIAHVPVLITTWEPDDRGKAVEAVRNADGLHTGEPAIVRNLVDGTSPVPVCSEAAYTSDTKAAVAIWNAGFGHTVLEHVTSCPPTSETARRLSSISVEWGTVCGACALPERLYSVLGGGFYTYAGQSRVILGASFNDYTPKEKVAVIAHELGHALGFPHPWEATGRRTDGINGPVFGCPGALVVNATTNRDAGTFPDFRPNVRARYKALNDNASLVGGTLMAPGTPATSAKPDGHWCRGDRKTSDGEEWYYSGAVALSAYDKLVLQKVYGPEAVADVKVADTLGGKVQVKWKAGHVHVEKGFEVQVKVRWLTPVNADPWKMVAKASVNATSATFERPADEANVYEVVTTATSHATYRVVSVTAAFPAPLASAISAEASHATATYELHVTDGFFGRAEPYGKTRQPKGETVTVTAIPDTGYEVKNWSGACDQFFNNISDDKLTCDVKMTRDRRVHVTFQEKTPTTKTCPTYTLTATAAGVGGSASGGEFGGAVVKTDETCPAVTGEATATWTNATHSFEGWSGCTSVSTDASAGSSTCSVSPMTADKSVTATFKKRSGGTTPTPPTTKDCHGQQIPIDQDCPAPEDPEDPEDPPQPTTKDCNGQQIPIAQDCPEPEDPEDPPQPTTKDCHGQQIPIDQDCPAPEDPEDPEDPPQPTTKDCNGQQIPIAQDCPEPEDPEDPPQPTTKDCNGQQIPVDQDCPAQPTTKVCPKYTFTVSATGGGQATGGGTYGGQVVGINATCPVATATASARTSVSYTFQGWTGDCSGAGGCSVTMDRDRSATAVFTKRYCYVSARVGSGSGTVSGGGNVHCGVGSATVTATASAGSCFSSWGGGIGQLDDQSSTCRTTDSVTFTKPETPVTAIAHFKAKPPTYYTLTVVSGSGSGRYRANTYATASASAGRCFLGTTYTFKRWSGDSSSTSRTISIYMNRNKSVTAVYTTGPPCFNSEDTPVEDDGGGPAWTEAPATESPDDPDP